MPDRAVDAIRGFCPARQRRSFYVWWRKAARSLPALAAQATQIGAVMAALIAFVLGTTLFLAAESAAARAEDKLEGTTTDSLTG